MGRILAFFLFLGTLSVFAQEGAEDNSINAIVVNAQTEVRMESVHVVNLNQVQSELL